MSKITISAQDWSQVLKSVVPHDSKSPHSWICMTKRDGGSRKIEVLSEDEYKKFFSDHSRWNSSCRKLSLSEIFSFSQNIMSETAKSHELLGHRYKVNAKFDANIEIENLIDTMDVFAIDAEQRIEGQLKKIGEEEKTLQTIPNVLQKMTQRAHDKHLIEKSTQGIWGKIKWHIWSWFYDKSPEVKKIQEEVPVLDDALKIARTTIQGRILINMEGFEEEINIDESERNDAIKQETYEKFNTPNKVKESWITRYDQNKYPKPLTEQANIYRNRVIAMTEIWEKLNKYPNGE